MAGSTEITFESSREYRTYRTYNARPEKTTGERLIKCHSRSPSALARACTQHAVGEGFGRAWGVIQCDASMIMTLKHGVFQENF
jgi:hypothetical protein